MPSYSSRRHAKLLHPAVVLGSTAAASSQVSPALVTCALLDEGDIHDETVLRLQNQADAHGERAERERMRRKRTHTQLIIADEGPERGQAIRRDVNRFLDRCRVPRTLETYCMQQTPAVIFEMYLAWSSVHPPEFSPAATFSECKWHFQDENMVPVGSTIVQLPM